MGVELVFLGPSGAGKTTLMRELAATQGTYDFTIDRPWTTRARRPGEDDIEYVFADKTSFDAERPNFLFTMGTYGEYEFGLKQPEALGPNEARMRILLPDNALRFRKKIGSKVILCTIIPGVADSALAERILQRDPSADAADVRARVERICKDTADAERISDISFVNEEGVERSATALRKVLESYFAEATI